MKGRIQLTILMIFLAACHSAGGKHSPSQQVAKDTPIPQLVANDTSNPSPIVESQPLPQLKTHLRDTTYTEGSFILFLCPNDARYAELESISEDTGTGDSDFGVGISSTLDSLKSNPQYKGVKGLVSTKRYIKIEDCLDCPRVIDRDTINYGVIMSAKGKHIDSVWYRVHSFNYLQEIDSYFFGKSN